MKRIILASASPQRKQLLEQLGLSFEVKPSSQREDRPDTAEPHQLVRALSAAKAAEIARQHEEAIVIAADTVIEMQGRILGKPETETEAAEMLSALNGRSHRVVTGFTVMNTENSAAVTHSEETTVHVRELSQEEIKAYVRSGEPLGKAGGYAVQGLGATLIKGIEGDFYNVVGLPVSSLTEVLKDFGIRVL